MSMIRTLGAAAFGVALLAIPGSGDAQIAPTLGGGGQAVSYSADGGEYASGGFALRGRAEVIQGDNRLRADAINGIGVDNRLSRIEASGGVYFVTPDQTIRGDRAVYNLASNEIVVTGDVILTQGQNVLTGGRLVYNTETESARMEGSSNGRIRGVFYPESNGN